MNTETFSECIFLLSSLTSFLFVSTVPYITFEIFSYHLYTYILFQWMTRLCIQFIEINHVYCLFISKIFLKILSLNIGKLQHLYYDV